MSEPPAAASTGAGRDAACAWLDSLRGPDGANHLRCRLTSHILGPGRLQDASCLQRCAYPKQQARGRCRHMDVASVILTDGDPPLPRIGCRAHHNFDAPNRCATCKDYDPGE